MASPSSLARRRSGQIMALFYRMAATYLWYERVRLRFAAGEKARAALRAEMWGHLGRLYRETALAMGGLLIKAGQILSARTDIFPAEFTRALASLQDTVPGVPFIAIREQVEREFERPIGEVFERFDPEPLAAASLGQVHKATLADGRPVVVKVLRPGVEKLIHADLEGFRRVVRSLLRWTSWAKGLDLPGIYYESLHILTRELDLREEARHTERFRRMFADHPRIAVPEVYAEHTRQRVLTLAFMPGLKVTDREVLREAGIEPSEVTRLLLEALSKQVLTEGFFHADPHPGNLLVQPGEQPTLVLLDFGMVGQLTPRVRQGFRRVALGLLARDPDGMLQGLDDLEMLRPTADRAALRRTLAWLFEKQLQGNLFELRPEAFLEVARELRQIFYSQAFQFPSDIAFLGRGSSITFGVCRSLDPSGDFIAQIEASTRAYLHPGRETAAGLREGLADLARLPSRLDRILTTLESGRSAMVPAVPLASRPASRGGGRTLPLAAVLFLGANQLLGQGQTAAAWGCYGGMALALGVAAWRALPPSPAEP